MSTIRRIEIALLIGACAIIFWWGYSAYNKIGAAPVGLAVVATEADAVKRVEQVEIEVKKPITVYGGGAKVKEKLKLPETVVADEAKSIIASSTVKADDHRQTVTTVLNTETGKSETFVVREALPWLAFSTNGEIGVYGGFLNGQQAVRVQVIQDFVQIKAVRIGGILSADQIIGAADINNPVALSTFAGVGVRYKW